MDEPRTAGPAEEAIEQYLLWANEAERRAIEADREGRVETASEAHGRARFLRCVARAELVDREPEGLP